MKRVTLIAVHLLLLGLLLALGNVSATDYTFVVTHINTYSTADPSGCIYIEKGQGDQYTFLFSAGGSQVCLHYATFTDDPLSQDVHRELSFTTNENNFNIHIEAFDKYDGSSDVCTFVTGDDETERMQTDLSLNVGSYSVGTQYTWSYKSDNLFPDGDDCYYEANGYVVAQADATAGAPSVSSGSLYVSNKALYLSLQGKNLNPDPAQTPSLYLTGLEVTCASPSFSDTSVSCQLAGPASGDVADMVLQVQVQTEYGVTPSLTLHMPSCSPSCVSAQGACYWSADAVAVECKCSSQAYYGVQCENVYSSNEPALADVSPVGGDYSQSIVIGLTGQIFPPNDSSITNVTCHLSWDSPTQQVSPAGNSIVSQYDLIYEASALPYDGRPVPQADSLMVNALCLVPANVITPPSSEKRQVMVRVMWYRNATGEVIPSQQAQRFLAYGPFSPSASTVRIMSSTAQVFDDVNIQVYLADENGNNRVGGGDADLFDVVFFGGPSTTPTIGINGGVEKSFFYDDCRSNPYDVTCAYYELTVSFDFAGTYQANTYSTDPSTYSLVTLNSGPMVFTITGLTSPTQGPPQVLDSKIDWATQIANRSDILQFDPALSQKLSPNTGGEGSTNMFAALLKRFKGGWLSQRQTASLAFETATSEVTFGSVQIILDQGTTNPTFCDTHTDQLTNGELTQHLVPWERVGNVPNQFKLIGLGFSGGDCITDITVSVTIVHHNLNSISLSLVRVGPPNIRPDALNTTTVIQLKAANDSTASLAQGSLDPMTFIFDSRTDTSVAALRYLPALADWTLVVDAPSARGHLESWSLDVSSEYCLSSQSADNSVCGTGNGLVYARASTVDDLVTLTCPQGATISSIVYARYGKLDGSCDQDNILAYDSCEANQTLVSSRVGAVCIGYSSCQLQAIDTQFGDEIGEAFLCPGELPPCPDAQVAVSSSGTTATTTTTTTSTSTASSTTSAVNANNKRHHHWLENERPARFGGTEDAYYMATHTRHLTRPYLRPRGISNATLSGSAATLCTYDTERVKKALMVKAMCTDSNAVFSYQDPVEVNVLPTPTIVMASVTGDFDNDWKEETITFSGFVGGPLVATFTYVLDSEPHNSVYSNLTIGGVPIVVGGRIDAVSGDFDRDGYPEVVFSFIDQHNVLRAYMWDLSIQSALAWGAAAKQSLADLQACGCYDTQAVIRELFDRALPVVLPDPPSYPIYQSIKQPDGTNLTVRVDSPGYSYSLAAGDVGRAGFSNLIVAWLVDGNSIAWNIFVLNSTALVNSSTTNTLRNMKNVHAISVNLGNYEGLGYDYMALSVIDEDSARTLLYSIDSTESDYPMIQQNIIVLRPASYGALWGTDTQSSLRFNLHMVSGDLDGDGDDEIVVATTAGGTAYIYRLDQPGGIGTKCRTLACTQLYGGEYPLLVGPASSSPIRSPEIRIAIGNIDDSMQNELVLAVEYTSTVNSSANKVMLMSLDMQLVSGQPWTINGRHCYNGPFYQGQEGNGVSTVNNIALSMGNLFGLGYRVGEPITVRFEGVPELVAVVNAPPTHYDILGGTSVIVNPGTFTGTNPSFSQLSTIDGIVSTFDITRELATASTAINGFQLDAKVAVVFGNVDLAWKNYLSNATNDGFATLEQIAVSRDLVASGDDVVLYISSDKDQYIFPIVDNNGNQVGSLDIIMSSSCGDKCLQKANGRDLWWFTPDHEVFNVLTYPSSAPSDFQPVNRVMVGEVYTMGPNAIEVWVDQQAGKSQNRINLNHTSSGYGSGGSAGIAVGVEYEFSGAFLGVGPQIKLPIGVDVSAGYNGRSESDSEEQGATTQSANTNHDASVHCYLEAIDPTYAYQVQPYVYLAYSSTGSQYLKVDYSAQPGYYPGVSNWWLNTYNQPDLTFNLPWWWTTFTKDRTMMTKEIVSSPAYPDLGEVVTVSVTVRNKALVEAQSVTVSLWRGSPDNCLDLICVLRTSLIGAQTIPFIVGQDQTTVTFLFKYDGTNNIHATLDDNNAIAEIHEDNNEGYNLLFHDLRNDGYQLQTVRLDSQITFQPVLGGTDNLWVQGYDISVTILGDTYTRANVMVQLWFEAVGGAGRLISTITVPRILGSVSSTTRYTVTAYWDTSNPDLYGQQTIIAVLLHSGFDTSAQNIISQVTQTLNVGCWGEVDVCGVCGGDNSECMGCDGIPLSGKVLDMCGKCGGDSSSCCIRTAGQATTNYVRPGVDSGALRIKIGDMVVFENVKSQAMSIVGGAYDYTGAVSFDLSVLQNNGFSTIMSIPQMNLDDATINGFVQQYLSWALIKDHIEVPPTTTAGPHPPQPDNLHLFMRTIESRHSHLDLPENLDIPGLALFDGMEATLPANVGEERLHNIRSSRAARNGPSKKRSSSSSREHDVFQAGICCAEEEDSEEEYQIDASDFHDTYYRRSARGMPKRSRREGDHYRAGASVSGGLKPKYSLRALALALLKKQKNQQEYLDELNNRTSIMTNRDVTSTLEMRMKKNRPLSFYDPEKHERSVRSARAYRQLEEGQAGETSDVRCLCSPRKSKRSPLTTEGGSKGSSPAAAAAMAAAGKQPAAEEAKKEDPKTSGSLGGGSINPSDVATAASMTGTTSFGVTTFDGFGAARGWSLFDFTSLSQASASSAAPATLAPGGASAPHRFFTSGIYLWHDELNPAYHGAIIVDPSDLQMDVCGVCGGDGTSCLDCKGVPNGRSRRDACGVCYDPFVDAHDPTLYVDCAGVCNGTARFDSCGYCTGGTTGRVPDFAVDCAGICNGTTPDFCGVCGADASRTDLVDCAGECHGPRVLNPCGYCTGGDTGLDLTYGMDCTGQCNGSALVDCFGRCNGGAKTDCMGVCNGTASINSCKQCIGGSSGLDDPLTKTCAGYCATSASQVCGSSSSTRRSSPTATTEMDTDPPSYGSLMLDERAADERFTACSGTVDCRGSCNGSAVVDSYGICCVSADRIDCSGLCNGSARTDCNTCVGGSSGVDPSSVRDCKGTCHGNATINACGYCVTRGEPTIGYSIDCNNVCNGSAYIDGCGVCVEGSTGVKANTSKDCFGVCFGPAVLDRCGVCYKPGGNFTPNSNMDCAGVCNGTAVIDDCGQCTLGTTKKGFNSAKDCAGQCFGQHVASDPECSCPKGQLDKCFVCGGNNTQCAGCDGIPWSGKVYDQCGVCGGNNTECCFLTFSQVTATIENYQVTILHTEVETGETLTLTNLQAGQSYTVNVDRTDIDPQVARVKQVQTHWGYGLLKPGNSINITLSSPGTYRISTVESAVLAFDITATFNAKKLDSCQRCIYPDLLPGAAEVNATAYEQCCQLMPSTDFHEWYTTVYIFINSTSGYEANSTVNNSMNITSSYNTSRFQPASQNRKLKLISPYTIDSTTWSNSQQILQLGDAILLENHDLVDHIVSIMGPQPMPDIILAMGTAYTTTPFLIPGNYRLVSNRNLVNTTFVVAFSNVCQVFTYMEVPEESSDTTTIIIITTTTIGGSLLVLLLLAALTAMGVLLYKRYKSHKQPSPTDTWPPHNEL